MGPVISLLALLLLIMNVLLSKWILGEKRKKVSETDGKTIHRWVMAILAVISIGVYIFIAVIDTRDSNAVKWFWPIFLLLMYSLQSFMEWKYLKASKQYVIPLILMVFGIVSILGIYFVNDQMKYTTFQEVVSDQLNEESTVRSISLTINDLSGNFPEREASTTIEDEEIIDRMLEDFSDMELKKYDGSIEYRDYTVRIVTTNQVEEDHFATESWNVHLDGNYIIIPDSYTKTFEIVSEKDHLKTIKSLIEGDEVDWEYKDE